MTITLPAPAAHPASTYGGGGPKDVGQLPTAGSPHQVEQRPPSGGSWFARNAKLVGAIAGGVVGGGIGFLTLGPLGGLAGAAVGALAGSFLVGKLYRPTGGGMQLPPPPPR